DRAVENFRTARRAVDQLLTRVAEVRIVEIPHMDVMRKELLEEALKFYLEFVEQDGQDLEIRRETACAWRRVGLIYLHLDQLATSQQSFRESIRRYDELATEGLLSPDDRRLLSSALSSFVWSGISDAEAIDSLNRAIGIMRQLIEDSPDSAELKGELADCYLVFGARMSGANPVAAERALRQALSFAEYLEDLRLAWIHRSLGTVLNVQGKPDAEQAYRTAIRLSQQLLKQPAGRVRDNLR